VTEPDEELVHTRAELLPEELAVGSDDPEEQARIVLEDSEERIAHPEETRRESSQTPD
jgi:hypothetical protein